METYNIVNRSNEIIFSLEVESIGEVVDAADLRGADLRGADLSGAYFSGAYLSGAYLSGADLSGADLSGADLSGAYLGDEIAIKRAPIQISGLTWGVTIWDEHMQIGCEFHALKDWFSFDNKRIAEMAGKTALKFWDQWGEPLRQICISDNRYSQ